MLSMIWMAYLGIVVVLVAVFAAWRIAMLGNRKGLEKVKAITLIACTFVGTVLLTIGNLLPGYYKMAAYVLGALLCGVEVYFFARKGYLIMPVSMA